MKSKNRALIFGLALILLASSCSKNLYYKSVSTDAQCKAKNGYWYKDKCWKDFEDEGIDSSKIDSIVQAEMAIFEKSFIEIDDSSYHLSGFIPIPEGKQILFITMYETAKGDKTLLLPVEQKKIKNKSAESKVVLFNGNALADNMDSVPSMLGSANIDIINFDELDLKIKGKLSYINTDSNKILNFKFESNNAIVGVGKSILEIKNNEAYLSGTLGTMTYDQIKNLIQNHPEVKTIVMTNVSGSVNDAVNMHTGRLLHENGFTTKVLSNSDIASGGVDLFCAGTKRIVEKGAKIGVHSWCCVNDLTAIEIPRDHPAHQYQLAYFTMALGPVNGPKFYFYTLEAAAFDIVHYMSDDEIQKWHVSTEFIETK